jgi:DNA-binding LytR/AlgR family response regulator
VTDSVILVDDEEDLREPVAAYLREHGLDVREACGGRELDALLAEAAPKLLVLDVTMPDEDGFSIARRLRTAFPDIGIVMLTARRDVIDRVVGLELGADDYIMKPFEPRELLARLRSVLRRVGRLPGRAPETETEELGAGRAGADYQDAFWVPSSHGHIRVGVETIEWIEAAKDYALLHTAERSYMIRATMASLEAELDPASLIRVHRSAFVRPGAVRTIASVGRQMTLELNSGTAVPVGSRYWAEVRERLKS